MSKFLLSLFWCAVFLLVMDVSWLTLNRNLWNSQVMAIQRSPLKIRLGGAMLAYVALILAVVAFAVQPSKTPQDAWGRGGLLGFCIYAVFDGTVLALFSSYKWSTAGMDILWGTFVCASASWATKTLVSQFHQ